MGLVDGVEIGGALDVDVNVGGHGGEGEVEGFGDGELAAAPDTDVGEAGFEGFTGGHFADDAELTGGVFGADDAGGAVSRKASMLEPALPSAVLAARGAAAGFWRRMTLTRGWSREARWTPSMSSAREKTAGMEKTMAMRGGWWGSYDPDIYARQ